MDFNEMTSAELQVEQDAIIAKLGGNIFWINDLLEINRILTIREVDEGWNS